MNHKIKKRITTILSTVVLYALTITLGYSVEDLKKPTDKRNLLLGGKEFEYQITERTQGENTIYTRDPGVSNPDIKQIPNPWWFVDNNEYQSSVYGSWKNRKDSNKDIIVNFNLPALMYESIIKQAGNEPFDRIGFDRDTLCTFHTNNSEFMPTIYKLLKPGGQFFCPVDPLCHTNPVKMGNGEMHEGDFVSLALSNGKKVNTHIQMLTNTFLKSNIRYGFSPFFNPSPITLSFGPPLESYLKMIFCSGPVKDILFHNTPWTRNGQGVGALYAKELFSINEQHFKIEALMSNQVDPKITSFINSTGGYHKDYARDWPQNFYGKDKVPCHVEAPCFIIATKLEKEQNK